MINHKTAKKTSPYIIKKKSNYYGFTLIELMVVMAIFSILAAVGVFSATHYLPNYRKQAAGRTVLSDLVKARIHAIRTRASQTVTIVNDHKYKIDDGTNTFLERDFVSDFDWKDVRIQTATNLTINADGTINNISSIDVHCGSGDPVSITMTITGNLRIAD
jgi:type IV fimbrial biogenesis protein FimT